MIRETFTFILPTQDECTYELVEQNRRLVCILPIITLNNPAIPPNLFQNIIDHIISLNKDYIGKLYFDDPKVNYRLISFKLFGHIRAALKKELLKPLDYNDLVSGTENYNWIESEFLPQFPEELDDDMIHLENKIKNVYRAFRKGKVKGIPYILPEQYAIKYNYFFELDPTDIKPVFDVYVNTQEPITEGEITYVTKELINKFNTVDLKLVFKE